MQNPKSAIKRWRIVITVFAVLISCLALGAIAIVVSDYDRADALFVVQAVIWLVASLLLWISLHKADNDTDSAGLCAIIAGFLTLPAGGLLILAGVRIRAAVSTDFENWLERNKRGSLGLGA